MAKQLITVILGVSIFWSNSALSYLGPNDKPGKVSTQVLKGANCAPSAAKLIMQFNDVKALIETGGSMFQNRAAAVASYEVPKGSGLNAIFAGALWMGGTDVNGQLKLAALRYREGNDFWPGPLTVTPNSGTYNPLYPVGDDVVRDFGEANIDPDQCIAYDQFYTIRKAEIVRYSIWWECTNGLTTDGCDDITEPTADELNRIYGWPAHGDVSRGQDYFLAPYYDRNADGVYNPQLDGDYPWYDDIMGRDDIECGVDRRISLFGDETHWWVFNDKGNIHTETQGDPIGMEIRAQAFSFATSDEVNRMTFYNYELINRGTQTLYDTYFAQYLDADVGNYNDDYAGCDVSRGLGYMYNGDLVDETNGGKPGYGENPPAIGCDFFEGPYQDADNIDNVGPYFNEVTQLNVVPSVLEAIAGKGIVYKGVGIGYSDGLVDNERFGMRRFTYYTSTGAAAYSDPTTAAAYYNYMNGEWANGSEMFYGGMGYDGSSGVQTVPTDYMFPSDSDPLHWATGGVDMSGLFPNGWDESTNNNAAGDRRFVQSAGPFILKPGAVNNITVGIVFGRGSDGDLFSSVEAMKRADTKAQALFDACFKILDPPSAPKLTIQELNNELILMIENPYGNNYKEQYAEEDEINITDPTLDRFFRFEGYQIYQLASEEGSVADITDPNLARLVAQCDIKNDISRIVNFEFDEALGYAIPVEKVDGENKGLRHSFQIKEDAFAQGVRTLVNHKTYYFVAVAYAFNEFKKYIPTDPLNLDGQKLPYISSRLSYDGTAVKSVSAIPHNPSPEFAGTNQRIGYGSSPRITRLDGHGNGNRSLEFTSATLSNILNNGYMENPEYEYGGGPINVKVVDPLNLVDGYFECKFRNYIPSNWNAADTASWVIYRYSAKNGELLDSVYSETTIKMDNEQIIPRWGVSVQINQEKYLGSGSQYERTTSIIDASVEFVDSSKRWLSFVPDNDAFYPTNWVRSGDYTPGTDPNLDPYDCRPDLLPYLNPCNYKDESGQDPDKLFAKILGGGIAPHRMVGYQADFMPLAYFNTTSPGSYKNNASISFLPSVNIVITSDKSLWTRCPVIEMGRTTALNVGGAASGAMRKSASVDKNGNPDGTGTGMGWFPGYAVDLESGARLYMSFGENSFLAAENGADMMWNPSERFTDDIGTPLMGGVHPVFVYSYKQLTINNFTAGYDFPAYDKNSAEGNGGNALYQKMLSVELNSPAAKRELYGSLSWIAYPMLQFGQTLNSTDVTIKLRVNKEYKNFVGSGENGGKPMYSWSMDDISTLEASKDERVDALKLINVVPNPYYAFSEYERTRLDTRVKITNLPQICTIRIYTVNGKLVRTFKKDSEVTSIDWDLNNNKAIPVAGGVYLIHVEVPEVGEVILKFFGGMRQVDTQGI